MKKERILIALLILAICVIVVMGAYIYNMSQKSVPNNVTNNTVSDLENDEEKVNEDYVDENIEEVAKKLIKEYLDIRPYERNNIGPMPYILVELGLETEENIIKLCNGIGNKEEYIKSNTKYDEFKNALLEYVSEEYFEMYYSQYKNIDGYVGFCNCAGGSISFDVEEVKTISEENDIYVFDVKFKDLEMYDHFVNGEDFTEEDYLFNSEIICKIERDKLVINSFLNSIIILDGLYIIDPSDVSYEFSKDGTVKYETNLALCEGTYRTVGENEVEIIMTKKIEWDENVVGKTTVTEIDRVEKVTVGDEIQKVK